MTTVDRAHDCLCNVDMGDVVQPDWMIRVKEDYFKSNFNMRSRELPEMLEEMDAHGVRRAVLLTNSIKPSQRAQEFVEAHPERFSLGLGGHNLLKPMPTLKALGVVRGQQPSGLPHRRPELLGGRSLSAD